ncbi:MAG: flagellar hook-basal body complex protein FliE [Pseudomonadota bacterium]
MTIEVLMPALSPTMEEGKLAKWNVKEGDSVTSGDVIAEIETDKATMEVEAVDEGTVGKILIDEGTDAVKVNTPIAILLEEGEDESALANAGSGGGGSAAPAPEPAAEAPAPAAAPPAAAHAYETAVRRLAQTLQPGEPLARAAMTTGADPHALVTALAQTELAVETAVTIRDRVVEAYQEILRMPV